MILFALKGSKKRIGSIVEEAYVKTRQRIRGFIITHYLLDRCLGNLLVRVDLLIRKTGILNRQLKKGYIEHNGFKIYFGEEDSGIPAFIVTNNDYETETREAIQNILKLGDVFVDLGANIGFFTLLSAKIVGAEGKVFAFEPTPKTRAFLAKNVSENNFKSRVVIEGYAISERRSKARFSVTSLSECNSISVDHMREDVIEVDTISIDEYFLEKGEEKIDLIKMDIEGQELSAMVGMKKINDLNQNLKIIFEYHKEQLRQHNLGAGLKIFQLLEDYGFNQFTVLFREPFRISIPEDINIIESAATRANLNILAEKIPISK